MLNHAHAIRGAVMLFFMEELEIVRESDGLPLGIYLPRNEALAQGVWCRSTNVFILNSHGEILCHQRSMGKERMPGVWSTHLGGHVAKEESFETNALKEAEEEAGITLHPSQLFAWRTTRLPSARLWVREFVALHDVALENLRPQPGEVEQFAWKRPENVYWESSREPSSWCAGTLDFRVEVECMTAVLTAARSIGLIPARV